MMCDTYTKQNGREKADLDCRHGEMASGGWQYRSAYFMDFDGSYYLVTISAAKSNDGLMVYNIGQMKKEAFPKLTALPGNPALSGEMLLLTVYPLPTEMSTPSFL